MGLAPYLPSGPLGRRGCTDLHHVLQGLQLRGLRPPCLPVADGPQEVDHSPGIQLQGEKSPSKLSSVRTENTVFPRPTKGLAHSRVNSGLQTVRPVSQERSPSSFCPLPHLPRSRQAHAEWTQPFSALLILDTSHQGTVKGSWSSNELSICPALLFAMAAGKLKIAGVGGWVGGGKGLL